MKKLLVLLLSNFIILSAWADHLVGAELYYTYKGMSASNHPVYTVTLRFFRNMHASVPSIDNEPVYVGAYYNTNTLVKSITLPFQKVDTLRSLDFPACVPSSLETIYEVGYFSTDVELPLNDGGYRLAWVRCCRTNAVSNMKLNDDGITAVVYIPASTLIQGKPNSSAVFALRDTVLLCNDQPFTLESGATDADGDSLSYAFYFAIDGASLSDPTPQPPNTLTLNALPYNVAPFTPTKPMGPGVSIDSVTGQISGTAPAAGTYLVAVRVIEWRGGKRINLHNKELLLKVKNCSYSVAQLKPEYIVCDSLVSFKNEAGEKSGDTYHWDFGVSGTDTDVSNIQRPQYKYPVAGEYNVTLEINKGKPCPAKATTKVKVYPGLVTGFTVKDSCEGASVTFTDTSHYTSGVVNKWTWDFGEPTSPSNTSALQHPVHTYNTSGSKTVKLVVGTNTGCTATHTRMLEVLPLPAMPLLEDELTICKGDTVTLRTGGVGSFAWSPSGTISGTTVEEPAVYPTATTTYRVTLHDGKCSSRDSVLVNVLPRDPVQIQPALPICEGDSLRLAAITDASVLQWFPNDYLQDGTTGQPLVFPPGDKTYKVVANPGQCETRDSITINVLNRPLTNAGTDRVVNEEQTIQLDARGADTYTWWPTTGLSNASLPNPFLTIPVGTDSLLYIVEGQLLNGCTRKDTVTIRVNVIPFVNAPSAFTPNGDGKNDVFRPVLKGGYGLEEFAVYNRWGNLLFQTSVAGMGWDGYTGTIPSAPGVYVWWIRAKNTKTGAIVVQKGTVVLVR